MFAAPSQRVEGGEFFVCVFGAEGLKSPSYLRQEFSNKLGFEPDEGKGPYEILLCG